jgi:hypothetical protein
MNWNDFEKKIEEKYIYKIHNHSSKIIVLFGSCHMSTIGFMLNRLLDYKYNICIILSWFFEKKGIENFNMQKINKKIQKYVSKCHVLIYHKHIKDYGVYASNITSFTNKNCLQLCVPNYRLDYTKNMNDFQHSLLILDYIIKNSDFPEFNFIIENYKNIIFFNSPEHPTHYLLFLQSKAITNIILNNGQKICMRNYYDPKNRTYFEDFHLVILPGKETITNEINQNTDIKIDAEYYDIPF